MIRSKPYIQVDNPPTEEPMKARCLTVTAGFLAMMLSEKRAWQITKNRLPEDVMLVEVNVDISNGNPTDIHFWFESSVFQETDPDDLPAIQFVVHHIRPQTFEKTVSTGE